MRAAIRVRAARLDGPFQSNWIVRRCSARLAHAAETLRAWTFPSGPLEETVAALASRPYDAASDAAAVDRYRDLTGPDAYDRILSFIPEGLAHPEITSSDRGWSRERFAGWGAFDAAARRYLAAKAFGTWAASKREASALSSRS